MWDNIEGFKGATAVVVVVIATRGAAPAHLVCTTTLGKPPMPVFFRSLLPAQLATRPPRIRAEVLPHVAGGVLELRHTPGTATAPWRDPLYGALQAWKRGSLTPGQGVPATRGFSAQYVVVGNLRFPRCCGKGGVPRG